MKKWLVAGAVVVAIAGAAVAIVMLTRSDSQTKAHDTGVGDAAVKDFRATERQCIATFNEALRRQRANEIDELELAAVIDQDVLVPWRAMRARVSAAPVTPASRELYTTLGRYLDARQTAWEAYAAALRAGSEEAARPHYDVYHQKNDEAQADARVLGQMFRAAAP
ncbi:MAG: hypothetical protein HOV81_40915 [Kofleriaceae bacterium]|nr:hypothetical protein [Kofleriaceae bacterium]